LPARNFKLAANLSAQQKTGRQLSQFNPARLARAFSRETRDLLMRYLAIAGVLVFVVLVFVLPVRGHEMHQGEHRGTFLYGKATGHYNTTRGAMTNCCTLHDNEERPWGDCKEVTDGTRIENLGEDGFLVDGTRFDREVVNSSPYGKSYICQKAGHLPHCIFATEPRT
jgi:hypothetical protein